MKRYILTAIAGLCVFCGCSDMMNTNPTVDVDKGIILKDAASMEVAMNGVYSTMYNRIDFVTANAHQCFGNMAVVTAAELMGEDMVHTAQGPGWFWNDYTYGVRQRYTSKIQRCYFVWKYFYEIINNTNYIISAHETAEGNKKEIDCIIAQAKAARAYSYFMLIQLYQQTYKGNENLPGVPVYTEPTTSSSKGKGRGTVQAVYDQINDDLADALELFKSCEVKQKHISNLDYYSTALLKARVALVQNQWAVAAIYAEEATKKPGCNVLTMSEATVVKGLFDDTTKEWTTGKTPFNSAFSSSVLWGVEQLSDQSNVYASFYSMMDACTDKYYAAESPKCISNWLYEQIPDTDIRKGWWNGDIDVPADKWKFGANINYNQHKFQWADQKSNTGDLIFMRMEEAYLILAEAQCRLGEDELAITALNKVLSNRDTDYARRTKNLTGNTQTFGSVGTITTLMDEILVQRRIELWGEVGRIFDIQRLGMGWTRYWDIDGLKTNHSNYLNKYAEYLNFPPGYIECILMIPQTEIDINPNINAEDQNPYIQNN